jgi:hypothetical protein
MPPNSPAFAIKPDPHEFAPLVDAIKPLLANKNEVIQSAVLADLLALWLAGHYCENAPRQETERMREELLTAHIELVRALLRPNEMMIFGDNIPGKDANAIP